MKDCIVVKIGSSLLTDQNGQLAIEKLNGHVAAIVSAKKLGFNVVLVTSAAIAAGFSKLGFFSKPKEVIPKQACAAVGQGLLMHYYDTAFEKYNVTAAQILLTKSDLALRLSYNNALNTLNFLLDHDVVPIINQNDTTATEEISFGDNDTIAARVAALLHAKLCIIFTDTDGLYEADPIRNPSAKKLDFVEQITQDIVAMTGNAHSKVGTGGMRSKVLAAKLANEMGIQVYVGDGRNYQDQNRIVDILQGKGHGTLFGKQTSEHIQRKKQWIKLHAKIQGTLIIDDGAATVLQNTSCSLLPIGVKECFGNFMAGDVVEVCDMHHKRCGLGISNYSASELNKVLGLQSEIIRKHKAEVIHRDDWVSVQ